MYKIPFRQIHLDFHTGDDIPNVGGNYNKKEFQKCLKDGYVNSINLFAKCHHGFMYYKDAITPIHPNLKCDLTREMLDACKEIGINTQIYLSAGLDEYIARIHPEWLFRNKDQSTTWAPNFMEAGYHMLCMNTPYLDYLLTQIKHVAETFETDGIWLDIVGEQKCYCNTCSNQLIAEGKDPRNEYDIIELSQRVYKNYLERVEKLIHSINPNLEIFQNSGHVHKGRRDIMSYYSHIELESLPTGGWGYDHFPSSARYVQGLCNNFLGMTGKFHTTWGEFGGFKHPNALRYEASLNLAFGAKVCIGDQMHPDGILDPVTYNLIGKAFKEVALKEQWCENVQNVSDIAVIAGESMLNGRDNIGDTGVCRMLLENHYLFDIIDTIEENLNRYKIIILPDTIVLDNSLQNKLQLYINNGGQLLATGKSGLNIDETEFMLDFGATFKGKSEYNPDYFISPFSYQGLGSTSFVMFGQSYQIELTNGKVIGNRQNSYFNRSLLNFSSHSHTPNNKNIEFPAVIKGTAGIYISWEIFRDYAQKGSLILKNMFKYYLDMLLDNGDTLKTNLPSQGIVSLQHQKNKNRFINHLLYAIPTKRGQNIEIIEDIIPIFNTEVVIKTNEKIKKVYLAPQNIDIKWIQDDDKLKYTVDKIDCHQMVIIEY